MVLFVMEIASKSVHYFIFFARSFEVFIERPLSMISIVSSTILKREEVVATVRSSKLFSVPENMAIDMKTEKMFVKIMGSMTILTISTAKE